MILQLLQGMGLNASLFVDGIIVGEGLFIAFMLLATMQLKGIFWPIVRSRLRKENIAIIDLGGIETPLVNYPRGSTELVWEHKKNKFSWSIPPGIERELANGSRYILANAKILGGAFNSRSHEDVTLAAHLDAYMGEKGEAISIEEVAKLLSKVRAMLSPKAQANTIDDRAKQLADVETANINKPLIYGIAVAIVGIVVIGGYLIMTKAMEYSLCTEGMKIAAQTVTTTTIKLPPL
jgi:hypothetical protein